MDVKSALLHDRSRRRLRHPHPRERHDFSSNASTTMECHFRNMQQNRSGEIFRHRCLPAPFPAARVDRSRRRAARPVLLGRLQRRLLRLYGEFLYQDIRHFRRKNPCWRPFRRSCPVTADADASYGATATANASTSCGSCSPDINITVKRTGWIEVP